ncbi:hypothetical protein A3F34_02300 [Candidatus Roizmanbacteria bacterium RIFCSPHIGHO2_12_FULL_44_10]|uniref:Uncharacterized protein n=1 Tax=Candidatus Roizmanbacteria bacterium RIFCSPHIGHO2_12_FULL_44_10 TaxID=1802054 RepID=A0A1F7I957_9BACT|nr:MAG: hypothetical protein A3F34_02300 [Candidatus Roizmanbacteria bacterium RIFCSPHIGHO2_12_FULL_44_10]
MDKTVYVCTGTCAAEISEEEHAGGLTVCGTEGCSMIGKPFEKRLKCENCGDLHEPKEDGDHGHDHNH